MKVSTEIESDSVHVAIIWGKIMEKPFIYVYIYVYL